MSCEDFQVAIERGQHGALPADERARLREHLSTCAGCRAYEAAAAGTERAMTERNEAVVRTTDWARVEQGIRGSMRAAVGMVASAVMGACLVLGLLWYAAAPEHRTAALLRAGSAALLTVAVIGLVAAYGARRLEQLERGKDMLEALRQGARARVGIGRVLPWVAWLLAARLAWMAVVTGSDRVDAPIFYGVLAAVLLGVGLWERFVRLPAARRELSELERDGLA